MITVTLTTDWGADGLYTGAFKGKLVSRVPGVQLVDITHQVDVLNPLKAVFALQHAYQYFMKKTIHIVGVGGKISQGSDLEVPEYICFQYNHHYFIGPNNGIWEALFGEVPKEVFALERSPLSKKYFAFPELEIFIDAVGKLAMGMEPKHLGELVPCKLGRRIGLPVKKQNQLLGEFLYFDVYGNGITNISKDEFYQVCNNRPFSIMVGMQRQQYITDVIADDYNEGDSSRIVALFSFTGYLEIAVPQKQLTQFVHIDKNTKILVQFYDSLEDKERDEGILL